MGTPSWYHVPQWGVYVNGRWLGTLKAKTEAYAELFARSAYNVSEDDEIEIRRVG